MKAGLVAASILLFPYASLIPAPVPGNPNGDAYAGQAGSVYDAAANPPHTDGVVAYNPMAPLPPAASTGTAPR